MTEQEAVQTVRVLASIYPGTKLTEANISAYAMFFKEFDFEDTKGRITEIARVSEFFPSIALISKVLTRVDSSIPTQGEAWDEVMAAVGRYGYMRDPVFSHPAIECAVNSLTWREICISENQEALRAHFFKIYGDYSGKMKRQLQTTGKIAPVKSGYARLMENKPPPEPEHDPEMKSLVNDMVKQITGGKYED